MRRAVSLWLSLACALLACHPADHDPSTHSAAPKPAPPATPADAHMLRDAETRRDAAAIGETALSSRDLSVRRAAARALARIADARAVELLSLALADEDPDVSTWAAYGLGFACRGHEAKTVHALIARAASLDVRAASTAPLLAPSEAIADSLGRCGGAEAESTLRAWLAGPVARAEAAALALGRLATENGQLADPTLVALLAAADRAEAPLENALYPCTRLASFNSSTETRVRELAQRLIAQKRSGREFAVRALGHTGDEGIAALGNVLADTSLEANLRAEAARELSALGRPGQHALWAAFERLATALPSDAELQTIAYAPLSALVDALAPPVLASGSKLQSFAELPIGAGDGATLERRKVELRCATAALLAGDNYQNARLLACGAGAQNLARDLAELRVIGREKLRGARKQAYLARLAASDDRVREAALGMLAEHAELGEAHGILAEALTSTSPGVVASAARVLSSYPERAARAADSSASARAAPNPDLGVVQALTKAYAATSARHNVEVQSLLLDAIGALQILSLKAAVTEACAGENPTLREHAEKALHLLGEQGRRCDKFTPSAAATLADPPWPIALITFETEVGSLTLTLNASVAPSALARVVSLVQAGFYDGMSVHRVVPGFVAQFGDPGADGYGGDDQPPLRCETSPIPFEPGSVGVALAGRDSGGSQLFVTLGRYPHLDGEYAWLGQAGPGWERLTAGDRILHAHASAGP